MPIPVLSDESVIISESALPDCCPDQLEIYFGELVDSHSWSTVKIDRLGIMFYWRYVLKRDWQWLNIIPALWEINHFTSGRYQRISRFVSVTKQEIIAL